ncbi:MAG: hypothetical protein AAGA09_03290 [Pseudomonadota bacterium]
MIKHIAVSFACILGLTTSVKADPHETIAGHALCGDVPTSFLFSITHQGGLDPATFKDPCRSGAGPCNDMFKARFEATRMVSGTAHISRLESANGFTSETLRIDGHALDVPPDGWNRQEPMRYEYEFGLIDDDQDGLGAAKTWVKALRYTDRIDGKRKLSLQIDNAMCQNIDFTHQRILDID